jgi:hypothetical protein
VTSLYPPPSDDAGREQLRLALGSVLFYARRAVKLGADEDEVYDQAVKAITQARIELATEALADAR